MNSERCHKAQVAAIHNRLGRLYGSGRGYARKHSGFNPMLQNIRQFVLCDETLGDLSYATEHQVLCPVQQSNRRFVL
jgi:hypothetical protein